MSATGQGKLADQGKPSEGKQTSSPPKAAEEKQTSPLKVAEEKQTSPPKVAEGKQTSPPKVAEEKQTSSPKVVEEKQTSPPKVAEEKQTSSPKVVEEKQTSSPKVAEMSQEKTAVAPAQEKTAVASDKGQPAKEIDYPVFFITSGLSIDTLRDIIEKQAGDGQWLGPLKVIKVKAKFNRDDGKTYKFQKEKKSKPGAGVYRETDKTLALVEETLFDKLCELGFDRFQKGCKWAIKRYQLSKYDLPGPEFTYNWAIPIPQADWATVDEVEKVIKSKLAIFVEVGMLTKAVLDQISIRLQSREDNIPGKVAKVTFDLKKEDPNAIALVRLFLNHGQWNVAGEEPQEERRDAYMLCNWFRMSQKYKGGKSIKGVSGKPVSSVVKTNGPSKKDPIQRPSPTIVSLLQQAQPGAKK